MKLPKIDFDEKKLIEVTQNYNIKEIYLFGSILTDNFKADSDIDIMITYKNDDPMGLFELFELKEKIKSIFNREVDLIEKDGLRNPYRKKSILEQARLIYAA